MIFNLNKITIICGHYGCGKTNFALNLAVQLSKSGEHVTLADLDIVNPYFRSSDYNDILDEFNIKLVAPRYARSNVDLPSLPAEMQSLFSLDGKVIIDAGGDDAGAKVLGRYSSLIRESGGYEMLYVINKYRAFTSTPEEAIEIMHEIEIASKLKVTGIVNNSHLSGLTDKKTIENSFEYALNVSDLTGLPLICSTVPKSIAHQFDRKSNNIYPVDILVKLPW